MRDNTKSLSNDGPPIENDSAIPHFISDDADYDI